jgi:hypothetical protein
MMVPPELQATVEAITAVLDEIAHKLWSPYPSTRTNRRPPRGRAQRTHRPG